MRSIGAVLAGYATLILGTTLVQENLLGGVSYESSAPRILVAAGMLTPIAGVVAGMVTGGIAAQRPLLHALPIAAAIAVETTLLYRTGRVDGPLWFETLAGGALAAGVIIGAVFAGRWWRRS